METRRASEELLQAAAEDLGAIFDSLRELGEAAAGVHRMATEAGEDVTRRDLISLRPMIRDQLRRLDPLVAGTGLLARPGLLPDAPMFVEWWCAGATEPFLLRVSLDPEHPIFSDYDTFEWFEGPWKEGSKRTVGPWVDYTGTGEHVMTLAVPVFSEGAEAEFLGVAGADVLVRRVEELAAVPLCSMPEDAALVNTDGRVIASNTSRLLAGSLLDSSDAEWAARVGGGWTLREDGVAASRSSALPWAVVVFPRREGSSRGA